MSDTICIVYMFVFCSRPETSFLWFMSPFKTLRYIIWANYKWYFIIGLVVLLLLLLLFLFIYSFPVSQSVSQWGVNANEFYLLLYSKALTTRPVFFIPIIIY